MKKTLSAIDCMSSKLLLAVIFANCICNLSIGTSFGEVTNLVAGEVTLPSWSGFSGDFDPYWAGDTMRLNWRRGDGGGVVIHHPHFPPWEFVPPKPTELLSVSRSVSSQSRAYVSAGGKSATADSSYDYDSDASTSDSGSWNGTLARYAQVIDLDDYVLGQAISLASIESDVSDSNYTLTSRIQTGGIIDPIVSSSSRLNSWADLEFAASYQVNRNSQFVLNGSFAGSAGLNAQFTIIDQSSGEVFYEQSLSGFATSTGMKSFSLRGEVSPGTYDFKLVTNSRNEMTPYEVIEQGEIGELNLDFSWIPWGKGAGDFDNNGVVGAGDLARWQEAFGLQDDGDLDHDGDIDADDYDAWYFSADVNDVNGDGFVGWFDDFSAWLATERPGDADGDRDSDGRDFLIWQRTYNPAAASAADLNGDGHVDASDLSMWQAGYGANSSGDADGDGDTDGRDFLVWQRNYAPAGLVADSLFNVPEPATSTIALLATTFLWHPRAVSTKTHSKASS